MAASAASLMASVNDALSVSELKRRYPQTIVASQIAGGGCLRVGGDFIAIASSVQARRGRQRLLERHYC